MFKIIMKRLHEVTLFVCVVNYDENINDYCFGRLLSTTFNRNCIFPSVLSSDQVSSRDEAFSLVPRSSAQAYHCAEDYFHAL